jgi:hypothetical protein
MHITPAKSDAWIQAQHALLDPERALVEPERIATKLALVPAQILLQWSGVTMHSYEAHSHPKRGQRAILPEHDYTGLVERFVMVHPGRPKALKL